MRPLEGIRACVFDAYGTIFDFASAAARCAEIPADMRATLTAVWRDKQLQYTWLRSLQNRYVDFWQVTGDALDYALDSLGLVRPELRTSLMDLYRTLPAFPEVPEVLRELKRRGYITAILSNGSPEMLQSAICGAGLVDLFDKVLSADAVRIFKTDPQVYRYCVDLLGLRAEEISFQSSNSWDAYAASDFGMRVVWCNRYGQRAERLPGRPDFEISDLSELPDVLGG